MEKKLSSSERASAHDMPCFRALELGCFTQYQLLARGSYSLRMKRSQLSSSPAGIRSGLVRTPNIGCIDYEFHLTFETVAYRWFAFHPGHFALPDDERLGSRSPLQT